MKVDLPVRMRLELYVPDTCDGPSCHWLTFVVNVFETSENDRDRYKTLRDDRIWVVIVVGPPV